MRDKIRITLSALTWAVLLLAVYAVAAHAQTNATADKHAARREVTTQAGGANLPVVGGGTTGQLTKWTGPAGTLGDSVIAENKYGQIGVGTTSPTSKLTVAGVIESTAGGVKFPDGTVQTTAISQMGSSALQPFAQLLSASFSNNVDIISATFSVPVGKRLVIETVSLRLTLPVGQLVDAFTVRTILGGQLADYSLFPNTVPASGSLSTYGITQPLKIYADPGTLVTATLVRSDGAAGGGAGFSVVISGYLLDIQ